MNRSSEEATGEGTFDGSTARRDTAAVPSQWAEHLDRYRRRLRS